MLDIAENNSLMVSSTGFRPAFATTKLVENTKPRRDLFKYPRNEFVDGQAWLRVHTNKQSLCALGSCFMLHYLTSVECMRLSNL